jgi:hypothetical protein
MGKPPDKLRRLFKAILASNQLLEEFRLPPDKRSDS